MGCGGRGGLQLMLLGLDTAVGGGGARLLDFLLERLELRGLRWLGGRWTSLFPLGALQVGGGTGLVEA